MKQLSNGTVNVVACILIVVTAFFAYRPGLQGGFIFDDTSNITKNPLVAMQTLSWTELKRAAYSMENRPISRASFGLNHLNHGYKPYGYKLTNLLIHILNGLLLYAFLLAFTRALARSQLDLNKAYPIQLFALLASLAWTLHPVNLTNVLYIVQRMNSLSTMFMLAGMLSYIHGRLVLDEQTRKGIVLIICSVAVFTPLAYLSKENGILLPGILFIIELTLFRFQAGDLKKARFIKLFFILVLFIPLLFSIYYIITTPGRFHGGYTSRYFTLEQRLLTETRILWFYVKLILLPNTAEMGLFHDDIPLSTGLLTPPSTLISILALALAATSAWVIRKSQPVIAFGILLFLAGHVMESTFIPLELTFEHRNYLPSVGLITIVFYYLLKPTKSNIINNAVTALCITMIAISGSSTYMRSLDWSNNIRLITTEVTNHPNAPRSNYEMGKLHGQALERGTNNAELHYEKAREYFIKATDARDNFTAGLFGLILATIDANKKVDPEWINELEYRLQHTAYEQVNTLWLRSYARCVHTGNCNAEVIGVERLFSAATKNPTVSNRSKGILSSVISDYELRVNRDLDKAIYYAERAVTVSPRNVEFRIRYTQLLVVSGKIDSAQKSIEIAKALDVNLLYSDRIQKLRKHIAQKRK
jgi:hypothetical protein